MLIHRRLPGVGPAPDEGAEAPPLRAPAGEGARRFVQAAKPPAVGVARAAGLGLAYLAMALLWLNLRIAAAFGIVTVWTSRRVQKLASWGGYVIPMAILAVVMVFLKALFNFLLLPWRHVALFVVGVGLTIEALLIGRLFTQIAYKEDVGGAAGMLLSFTDDLVQPFKEFEGTVVLHNTGVVEFATLTAMEFYLVATIVIVVAVAFWSEFLHMYRRVRDFFIARSMRRRARREQARTLPEEYIDDSPATPAPAHASADLSAAS